MDTRKSLLKAICDHPDEDTPRLMYADFIMGEGKRAEGLGDADEKHANLIMMQCRRTSECRQTQEELDLVDFLEPHLCPPCPACFRLDQAHTAEIEFYRSHASFPCLCCKGTKANGLISRGFCNEIVLGSLWCLFTELSVASQLARGVTVPELNRYVPSDFARVLLADHPTVNLVHTACFYDNGYSIYEATLPPPVLRFLKTPASYDSVTYGSTVRTYATKDEGIRDVSQAVLAALRHLVSEENYHERRIGNFQSLEARKQ
jgi:uncharacterized protein (TIGR02996 family)